MREETPARLSGDDEQVLRSLGSLREPMPAPAERASTKTARAHRQLLADALSVRQVAALLHITERQVRLRLAHRELFGIRTSRGWRVPAYQFTGTRELPGLARILAVLPADVHPLALGAFLTRPNTELRINDTLLSPAEWLTTRRSRRPVVFLAEHLHDLP